MKNWLILWTSLLLVPFFSCEKEDSISVSVNGLEAGYQGDSFTVSVQATSHWTVVANYQPPSASDRANYQEPVWYQPTGGPFTDTGWININVSEGDAGTTDVVINIDAYNKNSRGGSVIFKLTDSGKIIVIPVFQLGKQETDISDKLSSGMKDFLRKNQGLESFYFKDILAVKELFLDGQTFDFMNDLVYFEQTWALHCSGCGITSFTSKMPSLTTLYCSDNLLSSINPDLFPELEFVDCSRNPLKTMDILSAPKLRRIFLEGVPLKELSLGPGLKMVSCRRCEMERLDLSQATDLEYLDCAFNNLKELDASRTQASTIDCHNNPGLNKLVFPEKDCVEYLYASSCSLSGQLSISSNTINEVSVSGNKLEKLSLNGPNLEYVHCNDNSLTEIVLPNNTSRVLRLNCENNLLTELGVITDKFRWEGSSISGNPGKDGIFTLYVSDKVSSYYTESYVLSWQWQWQGQDISVKVVIVPS
ncbi:MAG: hypothetical protein II693_01720 [Bacteroidales bacterium]|nr:hypothetical protein [Bacteroidales bacterium]